MTAIKKTVKNRRLSGPARAAARPAVKKRRTTQARRKAAGRK